MSIADAARTWIERHIDDNQLSDGDINKEALVVAVALLIREQRAIECEACAKIAVDVLENGLQGRAKSQAELIARLIRERK